MAQTLTEKIAQRFAAGLHEKQLVRCGDYISIRPAYVMTHDNTSAVIPKFKSIGAVKVANRRQIVFTLDHNIQDKSKKTLEKYGKIESFAREMGIDFYPAGRGIGHQIMCEEGYAWPGTMVVASDSHSNLYGGLGCLGTPIVRTDAAAIWATGRTWWHIPNVAKVELKGKLRPGVSGKDIIITLCGCFNNDEVLNHAIEFTGEGVSSLSIDQRLTIANMTTEWGSLTGLFPVDTVTIDWLKNRAVKIKRHGPQNFTSNVDGGAQSRISEKRILELERSIQRAELRPDKGSKYAIEIELDLETVSPHVAGPDNLKTATLAREIKKKNIKIDKAYIVSCVNSRVEDLAEAARVLDGKKIHEGVELYVAAASSEVQADTENRGVWQVLLESGAIPLPPGCGPCIGLGKGLLEDGEVCISSTNRNFRGRMGSKNAIAYLASPAVVAQSAISGKIDIPEGIEKYCGETKAKIKYHPNSYESIGSIKILKGFHETLEGELVFCHQDNLNTDSIYPGKYTYIDDFTPEQQAGVVMENYDPEFGKIIKNHDFLVGGFNFGSGSSREQAATSLKYRGIRLIIAGSFSETYKRNALNNGFLLIESPELSRNLKERFGTEKLTIRTGILAKLDFRNSILRAGDKQYKISPVGEAAQELVLLGGLENWVKEDMKNV